MMSKKTVLRMTASLILLWAAGPAGPAWAQAGLALEISVNRDVLDQGDPAVVTFKVINESGAPYTVEFGGCQRRPVNLYVYDEQINLIWGSTSLCPPCVCTADIAFLDIPVGEYVIPQPVTWNQLQTIACQVDKIFPFQCGPPVEAGVGVGTYYLWGNLHGTEVFSNVIEVRVQRF